MTLNRVRRRCDDIKTQEVFTKMRNMKTMKFYSEIKVGWSREEYVLECNNKIIMGWSWYRLGLWKSRGGRRNFPKDKCPLCGGVEDEYHILLLCCKLTELRKEYIEEKKLRMHYRIALLKIVNEKKKEEIRRVGTMLWRIKCAWMKEIEKYGE